MKLYIAGPEVFLPDASEVLATKGRLAREAGFVPLLPEDLGVDQAGSKWDRGAAISAADENMMLSADLIIANLTPFRGISADVGTVFELGFMCGLAGR